MKGLITKVLAAACGTGLLALAGCNGTGCSYDNLVDPCYPQRYEYMSRKEVYGAFGAQVAHGHMLDQTVWGYHFDPGTDRLNAMGLDHLAYLARRLPQPDTLLFLQTAQDVTYDPAAPDKMADARADLNAKRIVAIQRFLMAQTAGHGSDFQVVPIDSLFDHDAAWDRERADYLLISAVDLTPYHDMLGAGPMVFQISPTPQRWGPPVRIVKLKN